MPVAAFASFGHRGFRYFWFGGFVTNSARWFQYVALPVVLWDLTRSPGWVGFAGFGAVRMHGHGVARGGRAGRPLLAAQA